ncbi:hypothetical protein H7X68_03115 [Candidatus Saccharibacteria bacterium]|nr:hypothetical protein [Candidatus Saccharibacteria bacterium]
MQSDSFERLKIKTKDFYGGIDTIQCPALNAKIHFTSEGFNHLRYSKKRERPLKMQEAKLQLVPKGKKLLEKTSTIQEYCDGLEMIRRKKHKKTVKESVMVQYWGFIAIINGTRLKVVVRRVDNGKYLFWSTVPLWRSTKYDKYSVIDRSTGDLTED